MTNDGVKNECNIMLLVNHNLWNPLKKFIYIYLYIVFIRDIKPLNVNFQFFFFNL